MAQEWTPPAVTAGRVDRICDMMRNGEWIRGKSAPVLADEWKITVARVEQLSAEAWRRVCAEADNPDKMRPEISGILRQNLLRADAKQNFRAIAQLAETYTKVIGARAPEKHEHSVVIAQFDAMNLQGKLQWLEERIKKLQDARDALIEESEKKPLLLEADND